MFPGDFIILKKSPNLLPFENNHSFFKLKLMTISAFRRKNEITSIPYTKPQPWKLGTGVSGFGTTKKKNETK